MALCAVGGYWYWSPHLAIKNARAAAASGNADKFAPYVDLERLRANYRERMRAKVAETADSASGSGLASLLFSSAAGVMVDAVVAKNTDVRGVAALVAAGRPVDTVSTGGPAKWVLERPTADKVIAHPDYQIDLPAQSRDRFVFERSGFATWRLTELRKPGMQ